MQIVVTKTTMGARAYYNKILELHKNHFNMIQLSDYFCVVSAPAVAITFPDSFVPRKGNLEEFHLIVEDWQVLNHATLSGIIF